jgi:hypothetical protein
MPLQEVARRAGLPSRLLSKQMLEAYGPLLGGLRLQHLTASQLLHILRHQGTRLVGITALELRSIIPQQGVDVTAQSQQWQLQQQELTTAIAAAFPNLRSLDLVNEPALEQRPSEYGDAPEVVGRCARQAVDALQPLGSCLTALKLCVDDALDVAAPVALRPFTALRCLHISWLVEAALPPKLVAEWLDTLACMPALAELDLLHASPRLFTNVSLWLPGLAWAAPQLTSLRCCDAWCWDVAALSVLQQGLTALKQLSFRLEVDSLDDEPALLGSILGALARRKGLTSLALGCCVKGSELQQAVPAGLQVTAWELDTRECEEEEQTVHWLLGALAAQTALTRLRVALPEASDAAHTTTTLYNSLRSMSPTLVVLEVECEYPTFDAARFMDSIAGQLQLKELALQYADMGDWPTKAIQQLTAMTHLQALKVVWSRIPGDVLRQLALLTQLRHLRLEDDGSKDASHFSDASLALLQPLQQLTCLQLLCPGYITGPGVAALRQLAALQRLELNLEVSAILQLHIWLLPLPPQLRMMKVGVPHPSVFELDAALVAAAKAHSCVVEEWDGCASKFHVP